MKINTPSSCLPNLIYDNILPSEDCENSTSYNNCSTWITVLILLSIVGLFRHGQVWMSKQSRHITYYIVWDADRRPVEY